MQAAQKKYFWRSLALLVGSFLVLLPGSAAAALPSTPTGNFSDFADLIDETQQLQIETELEKFRANTSIPLAVVTIKSLEGDDIRNAGLQLARGWKVSDDKTNKGALLLIAVEDRELGIEVATGSEGDLTDLEASQIIRNVLRPAFRNEQYDVGIRSAVATMQKELAPGYDPTIATPANLTGNYDWQKTLSAQFWTFATLAFFAGPYLAAFFGRSKAIWPGAVAGIATGGISGWLVWAVGGSIFGGVLGGLLGLALDAILSQNYNRLKAAGKPTDFGSSRGGWWWGGGSWTGKSSGGGGFGGFGGGSSFGGGGSSGKW